jgi:hypothetical protein
VADAGKEVALGPVGALGLDARGLQFGNLCGEILSLLRDDGVGLVGARERAPSAPEPDRA